jgi:selenide,water dikinase
LGLNILGLPAEADLSSSRALLVAAAEAARAAGAVVVGGHTIRTPEPLYGLAVVGFVTPQAIWTISGAQAGDVVLLTKPLGTGVLISRARRDKDAARVMVELAGELTLSHGPAVDALRDVEVHAATDVSGFGLAGHAADLADASGVTLALRADGVPIYAQARSLLAQGHTTSLTADNERDMRGRVDVAPGLDRAQLGMLYDPQSAGPLLLVVAAADAVRAVAALRGAGCRAAVAIGRVSDRREASVEIRLSEPECPA